MVYTCVMDYNTLKKLVDLDYSIRGISEETGKSVGTVRHWLRKYSLKTNYKKKAEVSRSEFDNDRDYRAKLARHNYKKTAEWVRKYKVESGCADCGYNDHHAGLEFDHLKNRNRKTKPIAGLMSQGINRIKKEIELCEVVCATHHRIRTWERLQEERASSGSSIGGTTDS